LGDLGGFEGSNYNWSHLCVCGRAKVAQLAKPAFTRISASSYATSASKGSNLSQEALESRL
jgi:hypothetical protein